MTYREPVDMLLEPGDLLTISWSGELRTVIVAWDKEGDLILRDLTEDETERLAEREGFVSVPAADVLAVVALARLSRHLAEDPATDRLAKAAGEGEQQ